MLFDGGVGERVGLKSLFNTRFITSFFAKLLCFTRFVLCFVLVFELDTELELNLLFLRGTELGISFFSSCDISENLRFLFRATAFLLEIFEFCCFFGGIVNEELLDEEVSTGMIGLNNGAKDACFCSDFLVIGVYVRLERLKSLNMRFWCC